MYFGRTPIAFDIGSSAIKVLELEGGTRIKCMAIGVLPIGCVGDGQVLNQEPLEEALKALLKANRISVVGRRAALSLFGSGVLVRRVLIPAAANEEFAQQIEYEAQQRFQMELSDLYWDHFSLPSKTDSQGRVPVFLVGVKRDVLDQYVALIHAVGMRVGIIDAGVLALTNMFEFCYESSNRIVAIVNVGSTLSQVIIIQDSQFLFSREIAMGGEEYTQGIAALASVTRDHAENLKLGISQGKIATANDAKKIIYDVNAKFVQEVRACVDFFFQSGEAPEGATGISQLFLCGGGAKVLNLDAALSEAMQVTVQFINPFQRTNVDKNQAPFVFANGTYFGSAVGMGMRKLRDKATA